MKTPTRRILPPFDWRGVPLTLDIEIKDNGHPGRFVVHLGGEVTDDGPPVKEAKIGICTAMVWKGLVIGTFLPELVHPFAWALLTDLVDASPDYGAELARQCAEWREENGLPPCVEEETGVECKAPCGSVTCTRAVKAP